VLEQYFEARGWACERTGEGEIVASASGSWAQYELRGVWRNEDQVLQFLAFPDIKVASEKRAAIYEALGLINEQLWLGHFEMWSGSGLIVFRHAAMVGETDSLSFEQAQWAVTPGQSAVLYDGEVCLGGGFIATVDETVAA